MNKYMSTYIYLFFSIFCFKKPQNTSNINAHMITDTLYTWLRRKRGGFWPHLSLVYNLAHLEPSP